MVLGADANKRCVPQKNTTTNRMVEKVKFYSAALGFILVWWVFAFHSETLHDHSHPEITTLVAEAPKLSPLLTPIKRETLLAALDGDKSLMGRLIVEWDNDAQILQSQGFKNAQRLSKRDYLKALLISRQLKNGSEEEQHNWRSAHCHNTIVDDIGETFTLDRPYTKFLPQTYAAATFLLAIAPPEQIIAIPSGMRKNTKLYQKSLAIPLDIDRYNSEKLYQRKPEIAFVAPYSHPTTLNALRNQGIRLFTCNNLESIPQIHSALYRIGQIANHPLEADLLSIFIDASLAAIDNHMLALNKQFQEPKKILFLNYFDHFISATNRPLTAHLIERLGLANAITLNTPLSFEQIRTVNPDCLIISCMNKKAVDTFLNSENSYSELKAVKQNRLYCIDDEIQQSPTQYVVLAYYDLYLAIAAAKK